MKIFVVLFSLLVAMPAWACIWDTDCPPGDKCVNGICKFKPPGGREPVRTEAVQADEEGTPIPQAVLDKMAADYFASERQTSGFMRLLNMDPHRCDQQQENGSSCVDEACKFLGNFGCDQMDEINRVGAACRGNHDGGCVNATCTRLGNFGCDQMDEVERVATMCRGNHTGKCVDAACNYLGNFGCDQIDEVGRVNTACRGVKASCLDSVCKKLGAFGCDQLDEIEKVAASCRGN